MDNEYFTEEKFDRLVKAVEESGYLLTEKEMNTLPCSHCICKTCLIAERNGGAPGCGDCYQCLDNSYGWFCNSCPDYYNTGKAIGSEKYWENKMSEKQ